MGRPRRGHWGDMTHRSTSTDGESTSEERERTAPAPDAPGKPDSPSDIAKPTWGYALRKTVREFMDDECTDLAAALTYYSVLALFPGIIALLSLVGLVGQQQQTVDTLLQILRDIGASSAADTARADDQPAGGEPGRRAGARHRPPRRPVVGLRLRQRLQPRDEPHLRDRRGAPDLEAAPRHAPHHARDGAAGRARRGRTRPDRPRRRGGGQRDRAGVDRRDRVEHRQVARAAGRRGPHRRPALLRHPQREAAQVPLDQRRRDRRHRGVGDRVGRVRLLRGELLQLRQDLRLAGRCHRVPAVAVDHQPGAALRCRARRRARARSSAPGRHRGRGGAAAASRDTRKSDKAAAKEQKDIERGRRLRESRGRRS